MKIEFDGEVRDLDPTDISLQQAVVITSHTGLSLNKWEAALADPESPAFLPSVACLYWLMLAQNGEPQPLAGLDFPVLKFYMAFGEAATAEAAAQAAVPEDPTKPGGEPAEAAQTEPPAADG